ncbi:MAG: fructosamine kinase family protein [Rhodomicrobium sp.]
MTRLAAAAAALLGGVLSHERALAGGDLSQILHITLADGRQAIVKGGPAPKTEAAMLKAIGATGAPAPAVLAVSGEALVLEAVPDSGSLGEAWADLGAVLAKLHAASGPSYGWEDDYAFGPVAIANGWIDRWPGFWAERRLLVHCSHLAPALARRVEALAADLENRLPAQPQRALLHGDLWSGNVLAANGKVSALIDPACYYGHGEVDIAMLGLFGQPTRAFFGTYGALEPGSAERLTLYRLWPALVHLRLFGGGYRPLVERLLSEAGV